MTTPAKHDIEKPSLWARFRASALWDPATRAAHNAWQLTVATWFVGGVIPAAGLGSVPWVAGLVVGATAAVGSVLASAATWKVPSLSRPLDTLFRLTRTFVVGLAAVWVASGATVVTFDWQGAALTALGAAVLSLVKTQFVNTSLGIGGAFRTSYVGAAPLNIGGTVGLPAVPEVPSS